MDTQMEHIQITITPNIRPIETINLQRSRTRKCCECNKMNQLYDKYNRLGKTQKFYVFLCLFVILCILAGIAVAAYVGIKLCIYAC
jgi:hypothetical protein